MIGCESNEPKSKNDIPTAMKPDDGGKVDNNQDTEDSKPVSNYQIIYETIVLNNNNIVIGTLMNEEIALTTKDNQLVICVIADSYSHNVINQTKESLDVELEIVISSNGRGNGNCEYSYWKQRNINHQYQYVTNLTTTVTFDVKIANIGDTMDYRDYNVYYDNENTYTYDKISKQKSYYDSYVSLCKEQYVQAIMELALESFNIIVNG